MRAKLKLSCIEVAVGISKCHCNDSKARVSTVKLQIVLSYKNSEKTRISVNLPNSGLSAHSQTKRQKSVQTISECLS